VAGIAQDRPTTRPAGDGSLGWRAGV